jgi:hypothetical protein
LAFAFVGCDASGLLRFKVAAVMIEIAPDGSRGDQREATACTILMAFKGVGLHTRERVTRVLVILLTMKLGFFKDSVFARNPDAR